MSFEFATGRPPWMAEVQILQDAYMDISGRQCLDEYKDIFGRKRMEQVFQRIVQHLSAVAVKAGLKIVARRGGYMNVEGTIIRM